MNGNAWKIMVLLERIELSTSPLPIHSTAPKHQETRAGPLQIGCVSALRGGVSDATGIGMGDWVMSYQHERQITLWRFRDELRNIPNKERTIQTDWGCFPVIGVSSYRGFYEDAALMWETMAPAITVSDMLSHIDEIRELHGYKGGTYPVTEATTLWLSRWGRSDNIIVTGIEDDRWCISVLTEVVRV